MEKLPTRKKTSVIKHYLSGLSYDEIAAKTGVSKGTVANVVADLKSGMFPEAVDIGDQVDLLRELSLDLKRSCLSPGQSIIGLSVLKRINECGLDPKNIDRWPLILKEAGSEEQVQEFVKMVYRIEEVQEKTGLDFEDLDNKVLELEKKAADLAPLVKKYDDLKKQLAELTGQRESLTTLVASLEEKYRLLSPRVNDLEKREQDLSHHITAMEPKSQKAEKIIDTLNKERQRFLDIGLSPEALAEFSQKVQAVAQHHDIPPDKLRERLILELENLDKGLGLEKLIQDLRLESKKQQNAISVSRKESETLKAVVAGLKQEKVNLEASIRETREKVAREITQISPVARAAVNQLKAELERGHEDILAEVRRLTSEATEVGKELGHYQEILQSNDWLHALLALIRGEESLEGKQVKAISLLVLRGTTVWIKNNKADTFGFSTLSFPLENLISELEQWKP